MTGAIIDITVPVDARTPVYPGDPPVVVEPLTTVVSDGVALSRLMLGSHTGTHIDPPAHFFADGLTVDALPLDVLIGPALMMDIAAGRRVSVEDVDGIPSTERLLLRTGGQPLGVDVARTFIARGVRLV